MTQPNRKQATPASVPLPRRAETRPRLRGGLRRAEVLDVVDEDTVLLRAGKAPAEEVRRAEIAVPAYVPAVGDHVLIEQNDEGCFVLGVLGAARRRVDFGGIIAVSETGVTLHAPTGDLTVSAQGSVLLRAGEVEIAAPRVSTTASEIVSEAGRIEVHAQRIVEQAGDVYRRVEGLAELSAGRARTLIEGAHQLSAGRTTLTSDEETVIDGKRILLG